MVIIMDEIQIKVKRLLVIWDPKFIELFEILNLHDVILEETYNASHLFKKRR